MRFILDTNICIYIIKKKPAQVFEKFKELPLGSVGISSINNEKEFKRVVGLKIENWTKN